MATKQKKTASSLEGPGTSSSVMDEGSPPKALCVAMQASSTSLAVVAASSKRSVSSGSWQVVSRPGTAHQFTQKGAVYGPAEWVDDVGGDFESFVRLAFWGGAACLASDVPCLSLRGGLVGPRESCSGY